jgi:hypothetical protein
VLGATGYPARLELLVKGALDLRSPKPLQSYAAVAPAGQPPLPPIMPNVLKDPCAPGVRRHLRKIFVDPLTGKAQWDVLYHRGATRAGQWTLVPAC